MTPSWSAIQAQAHEEKYLGDPDYEVNDKPGAIRFSEDGDIAFLTADTDAAPWYHITLEGQRYWASHEDVAGWTLRSTCP